MQAVLAVLAFRFISVSAQATPVPAPVTQFLNRYINFGATSMGGAPNCGGFLALFGPNATTRTPVAQSGTGCQDESDPAVVCKRFSGFSSMHSELGTTFYEYYSASFARASFTWTLGGTAEDGSETSVAAMTQLTLLTNQFGITITNE